MCTNFEGSQNVLKKLFTKTFLVITVLFFVFGFSFKASAQYVFPTTGVDSGNIGLEGTVSGNPPTQAATIVSPASGAVFSELPVTVSGWCPNGLLVKVFKNNVFGGAVMCSSNNYSIAIDLFSGQNDLVARVYDALNQSGPDSNVVTVTFSDAFTPPNIAARVNLTSNYASRGANPKEALTWPIIVSGGESPYAISVDWGDNSAADVHTILLAGEFTIQHTYEQSGVYRVLIKASDKNGAIAYLQLVGVGNGEVSSTVGSSEAKSTTTTVIVWQIFLLALLLVLLAFWLGRRYEITHIKQKIRQGEPPFN
jgi:hypothetical protein